MGYKEKAGLIHGYYWKLSSNTKLPKLSLWSLFLLKQVLGCYSLGNLVFDELLLGGEVQETSKKNVLKAIAAQDLLQEEETPQGFFEDHGLGWLAACVVMMTSFPYKSCISMATILIINLQLTLLTAKFVHNMCYVFMCSHICINVVKKIKWFILDKVIHIKKKKGIHIN